MPHLPKFSRNTVKFLRCVNNPAAKDRRAHGHRPLVAWDDTDSFVVQPYRDRLTTPDYKRENDDDLGSYGSDRESRSIQKAAQFGYRAILLPSHNYHAFVRVREFKGRTR